jgi:hypothetical protein
VAQRWGGVQRRVWAAGQKRGRIFFRQNPFPPFLRQKQSTYVGGFADMDCLDDVVTVKVVAKGVEQVEWGPFTYNSDETN